MCVLADGENFLNTMSLKGQILLKNLANVRRSVYCWIIESVTIS
jgi:hypothetical protein